MPGSEHKARADELSHLQEEVARLTAQNKALAGEGVTLPRNAISIADPNERHYLAAADVIQMLSSAGIPWRFPSVEKTPEPVSTMTVWPKP